MSQLWRNIAVMTITLAAGFLVASVACAVPPSVIDSSTAGAGSSMWSYRDLADTALKASGGYARFEDIGQARYVTNPHGGYDSTTSRCKTCHAVHRAQGAYALVRTDSSTDVCEYCHIGGSAHSALQVYTANPAGPQTDVGHPMGGSAVIPASSTFYSSISTAQVQARDEAGVVVTATVVVRSVDTTRNRLFRLVPKHTYAEPGGGAAGFERVGPTLLTCASCHQVHGAPSALWRPVAFPAGSATLTGGYKLLKSSPSGSIQGATDQPYDNGVPGFTVSYTRDGMRGLARYSDFVRTGLVDATATVRAPETTLSAGMYGLPRTTWDSTAWAIPKVWASAPPTVTASAIDPRTVNQFALSAWCADCHNLTIGHYPEQGATETTITVPVLLASDSTTVTGSGAAAPATPQKSVVATVSGQTSIRVVTDLRSSNAARTVAIRIDFGAGIGSVQHTTNSTSFVTFTDTFTVPPSVVTTSVAVSLWRTAGAATATNHTLEVYGTQVTAGPSVPTTVVADLSLPAHESSRTHSAPLDSAFNGAGQCFTCHRGGLSSAPTTAAYDPGSAACERCHYGSGAFAVDPQREAGSDFPHSGETSGVALLGAWTFTSTGSVVATVVTPSNVRGTVCRRCHIEGSRTHTTSPLP